jgi:hypothetical protein
LRRLRDLAARVAALEKQLQARADEPGESA